jgi:large subunit ribosomal protein L7/L12
MPPFTRDEIVEAIKTMSVLELSELSKTLQKAFGVSPTVPNYGGGAPAPPAPEPPKEPEPPTSFDVVLTAIGDKKINVIKVVREVTSLGLKEAKDLVDSAPAKIKEGVNMEDARALQARFEGEGAKIEIKPVE